MSEKCKIASAAAGTDRGWISLELMVRVVVRNVSPALFKLEGDDGPRRELLPH